MCKAKALTHENYILKLNGEHNHDPEIPEIVKTDNVISHWIFSVVLRINSIIE